MIDLRCGDWRDVLADVGQVDALICDPPYGVRTHTGHDTGSKITGPETMKQTLCYASMSHAQVMDFAASWAPRVQGWIGVMSCSDLAHVWRRSFAHNGLYAFAPVICVNKTPSPRITGDGPTSAAIYLNLARPKRKPWSVWGSMPGRYMFQREPDTHIGGKSKRLMAAILRDYTLRGDLVCDPFSGGGTTAIACESLGRRFVGAEIDPETHAKAIVRIAGGVQIDMFGGAA